MSTDLQKGDIILFFAGDSWMSKSIAYLTNSEVTHAAMVYSEDSIVELLGDGVHLQKVKLEEGRKAYLMRHDPRLAFEPLKESADKYLNSDVIYDFPGLYLLGGLLIYNQIMPTSRILKCTRLILESGILFLDKIIQKKILHHSGKPMVCAQFIYQIFYDCGGDYRIAITDGCLSANEMNDSRPDTVRLIDLLNENHTYETSTPSLLTEEIDNISSTDYAEKLAKELYLALTETNALSASNSDTHSSDSKEMSSVLSLAEQFLDKLKLLLEKLGSDLPLDAMFVNPGDLAYHAPSLKRIDTIYVERT